MTPQERKLIEDLFDRLAQLENQPRDREAQRAILNELRRAPHSIYPLVQTVLVQDEALKAANARLEALESGAGEAGSVRPSGFLDNMREALFGRAETGRGSVPSVSPSPQPPWPAAPQSSPVRPYAHDTSGRAPSFLGTAAATAAGMVGGALLLDGVRSVLSGYHQGGPFEKTFGELNAAPRFDDGSHWEGRSNESDAPLRDGDEAYESGETDFADGGFDDGSDGLDSA